MTAELTEAFRDHIGQVISNLDLYSSLWDFNAWTCSWEDSDLIGLGYCPGIRIFSGSVGVLLVLLRLRTRGLIQSLCFIDQASENGRGMPRIIQPFLEGMSPKSSEHISLLQRPLHHLF